MTVVWLYEDRLNSRDETPGEGQFASHATGQLPAKSRPREFSFEQGGNGLKYDSGMLMGHLHTLSKLEQETASLSTSTRPTQNETTLHCSCLHCKI